jgi:DNA-3-methyladenine glycosylase
MHLTLGLNEMRQLRSAKRKETSKPLKDHELSNGPSKLCTALDITKEKLNNTNMVLSNLFWIENTSLKGSEEFSVVHTTRIGINSYGQEAAQKMYRYYILGNKHVSVRDKDVEKKMALTL